MGRGVGGSRGSRERSVTRFLRRTRHRGRGPRTGGTGHGLTGPLPRQTVLTGVCKWRVASGQRAVPGAPSQDKSGPPAALRGRRPWPGSASQPRGPASSAVTHRGPPRGGSAEAACTALWETRACSLSRARAGRCCRCSAAPRGPRRPQADRHSYFRASPPRPAAPGIKDSESLSQQDGAQGKPPTRRPSRRTECRVSDPAVSPGMCRAGSQVTDAPGRGLAVTCPEAPGAAASGSHGSSALQAHCGARGAVQGAGCRV